MYDDDLEPDDWDNASDGSDTEASDSGRKIRCRTRRGVTSPWHFAPMILVLADATVFLHIKALPSVHFEDDDPEDFKHTSSCRHCGLRLLKADLGHHQTACRRNLINIHKNLDQATTAEDAEQTRRPRGRRGKQSDPQRPTTSTRTSNKNCASRYNPAAAALRSPQRRPDLNSDDSLGSVHRPASYSSSDSDCCGLDWADSS